MKSATMACAIAFAGLSFSSLSMAQHDRSGAREDQPRHAQQRQQQRQQNRHEARNERRDDRHHYRHDRRDDHRYDARQHGHPGPVYYYNARGPQFHRGGYMPRAYRNQQYYVTNYRAHRLASPPRGHVWVQVGGDYVLTAIATGIIASIILSH